MDIILASASPRRKELFQKITENFKIVVSNVEEIIPKGLISEDIPEYFASLKAKDVSCRYKDDIVIGCDTAVFLNGEMLGKPKDREDAVRMLSALSGKVHYVITGCCICMGSEKISFSVKTEVEFFELTDDEIEEYIKTSESFDKAGSYGIQGKGALLVKRINGDYFNVVGLPVSELNRKFKEFLNGCH